MIESNPTLTLTPEAALEDMKRRKAAKQAFASAAPREADRAADAGPPHKLRTSEVLLALAVPFGPKIVPRTAAGDPRSISATYFTLRRGLGFMAFVFPLALLVGGGLDQIQQSLSAYYHFARQDPRPGAGDMRNVFVGILCAVGISLFLYKGYSRGENNALNIAGGAVILVAWVPMDWPEKASPTPMGEFHKISAMVFFFAIGYVCVRHAKDTLADLNDGTKRRMFRRAYYVTGSLILAVPAVIFVLFRWHPHWVLVIEWAGVWIFAAFWLIKSYEIFLIEEQ